MKRVLLLPLFLLAAVFVFAQLNTGINTSTWGGVSNVNWNPAIADGRYKADVSLGCINGGLSQNYLKINDPSYIFKSTFPSLFTNQGNTIANLPLDFSTTTKPITVNQWTQVESGSFMFPFGKGKNAVAVSWHYNNARTIHNLPGIDGQTNSGISLAVTQAKWMDIGLTYSRVVLNKEQHFVKVGVTIKPLIGLDASTFSANNFTGGFDGSKVSINNAGLSVSRSTGMSGGFAGDIGFVYEWRPDKDKYKYDIDTFTGLLPHYKNLYKLALGFSIIDMGALFTSGNIYKQEGYTNNSAITTATVFNTDDLTGKFLPSGVTGSSNVMLPTRFNIYLDYNIGKGFGLNLNASASEYFNKSKNQITHGSYISLVPRFDMPMIGVYLPFAYNFTSGQPNLGISLRAGPVWFGVSDFIGMATGKIGSAAFFAGVKIPIFYRKPKDKDGDKVSKKYDLCPFEQGTWASQGCPDKDGDGVRNQIDDCPNDFGKPELKGCPDADNDGIPDKDDQCPDIYGLASQNGCADKDNDGIPDPDDRCPDEAGPAQFHGCPDTDGDGISDLEDKCKDKKGLAEHHGCPDTDGDGVYDNDDDNPLEAGPIENRGNPWGDSDGDGIPDNEDSCRIQAGLREYHGCPTPAHHALIKETTTIYDTLFFESNKFDISAHNENMLRVFAQKMQREELKYYDIVLIGHTDNTEWDSTTRQGLSLKRAKEAYNELLDLGINKKRIEIDGLGDEQPIGDNKKATGRRLNRRVMIYTKMVSN